MPKVTLSIDYEGGTDSPRVWTAALGFTFDETVPADSVKRMFGALANAGFDSVGIEFQERPGYEIYRGMTKAEV